MDESASFGAWLQRRRKALDLTQAELAQRVGCALGTIRHIEQDERRPSKQLAGLLADALAIPAAQRAAFLLAARAEVGVNRLAPPAQLVPEQRVDEARLPRGTVTFLFTDIEGSTQLWEQHPQAMPGALAREEAILRSSIQVHGGVVFKTVGDAVCAVFARASDALAAALEAQRALQTEPWGATGALRVRVALHTGAAEERDTDYVGPPLNRVARLLAAGHGGQVLLSLASEELVREELPPEAALRDLGSHRLKDLSLPEQIFQLVCADLPADFPPLATLDARQINLPIQPTPLIGREQELATVQDLLQRAEVRLLTLTGPGGVGKTRLGLQVAAELLDAFADGIYFVDLAPIRDPDLVATTIAQTLGVPERSGQAPLDNLRGYLCERQVLLLLDNFEQVLEAAPVVAALLAAAPGVKILITSRAVLRLRGEKEHAVPPLALPDPAHLPAGGADPAALSRYAAVALFIQRVLDVQPMFAVTNANAPAVVEICARLEGLPLAIELAATRIKLFPPEALLKRLEHRLPLLTGGARDLPARQQTLRHTIAWSYDLLRAAEQTLFRRLAVFVGGWTLEAAEAVASELRIENVELRKGSVENSILNSLAELVDQSLLREEAGEGGEPRFIMLETLREYALERLEASGEANAMRRAHAAYYLALAEAAEPELQRANQGVWLARLEAEHDNLRAALEWSQATAGELEVGLRLAGALGEFWWRRGYLGEGPAWVARALAQAGPAQTSAHAKALRVAGVLAFAHGGTPRQGIALLEESLTLCREMGDRLGSAWALFWLGHVALDWDDLARATARARESLVLFRECGERGGSGWALYILARVAAKQGEIARRPALLAEGLALFQEIGDTSGIARVLLALGELASDQGNTGRAIALLEESLAHHRVLRSPMGMAFTLLTLGTVVWKQGDAIRATALLKEGLTLFRDLESEKGYAQCLVALAALASAAGQFTRAARLCGAAAALTAARGGYIAPEFGATYDQIVALTRTHLDAATFAAEWAEGQAMTREQAIAYALAWTWPDDVIGLSEELSPQPFNAPSK